jgi:hypothetical protein
MQPGSFKGLQLVVSDIHAAHAYLAQRGVDVSPVQVYDKTGIRSSGKGDVLDNVGFVFCSDSDGNGRLVQQISARGQ